MKRFVGSLLTVALAFSVSTSAFASVGPVKPEVYNKSIGQIIHPKYVETLVEKKEVAKIKAVFEADIAILEESLKTLRDEMKALREVKPVDEAAMSVLKEEEKALNDQIKSKRDSLHKLIERVKMVIKYGEAAVAEIEAAQAAFAVEESAINESKATIKAEIDALLAAESVDEEKVAELRAAEKALNDELKDKRDAMHKAIERIKLVAEYGEDVILKIEEEQSLFEEKIIVLEENKNAVKEEIKALREVKPIDEASVSKLMEQEKTLNDQIRVAKETFEAIIDDILYAAITK